MTPSLCAKGYYCPPASIPLTMACGDMTFTLKSGGNNYADCLGTYALDTRVLNGFPIYVNAAKSRFLGYHPSGGWVITGTQWLSEVLALQGSFGGFHWNGPGGQDPTDTWVNYEVSVGAELSAGVQCPEGSVLPKKA
jgi:hypothetical protein